MAGCLATWLPHRLQPTVHYRSYGGRFEDSRSRGWERLTPGCLPAGKDPIDTLPIGGADDVLSPDEEAMDRRHLHTSFSVVLTLSLSFGCSIDVHRMTHATQSSGPTGRRPAAALARQIAHAGLRAKVSSRRSWGLQLVEKGVVSAEDGPRG